MTDDKDIKLYLVHGEVSYLFTSLKDKVFELRKLGSDTTPLLLALNSFAQHMVHLAKSESERHERKSIVDELLSELNGGNDERKKT